jgi:hypothetical protein
MSLVKDGTGQANPMHIGFTADMGNVGIVLISVKHSGDLCIPII